MLLAWKEMESSRNSTGYSTQDLLKLKEVMGYAQSKKERFWLGTRTAVEGCNQRMQRTGSPGYPREWTQQESREDSATFTTRAMGLMGRCPKVPDLEEPLAQHLPVKVAVVMQTLQQN